MSGFKKFAPDGSGRHFWRYISGTVGRIPKAGRVPKALRVQAHSPAVRRVNPLAALLALAGVILPTEMQIYVAGARFSPGRIAVVLLLFPALFILCQKGRRALLCDFLACAAAGWIVIAAVDTVGWSAIICGRWW
jgi:hypothetical protein